MARFEWFVAKHGYRCATRLWQDLDAEDPTRTEVLYPEEALAWRRYAPLVEYQVLYRTFAETEPTVGGILDFASRFGLLGLWGNVWPDDTPTSMPVQGESVAQWQACIRELRDALTVWDVIQQQDRVTMASWVLRPQAADRGPAPLWAPDAPLARGRPFVKEPRVPDGMLALARREPYAFVVEPPVTRDVWGRACAWLQAQLNWHLTTYATLYLGHDAEAETVPFTLEPMPQHLYGALWLQFASSLGGEAWDRHCVQCGEWFRVPVKARRPNTAYCSTQCRARAARQRHAAAAPALAR